MHLITADELVERFLKGEFINDIEPSLWISALRIIDAVKNLRNLNKESVHTTWVVNGGHLRRKIQDDGLILRVLRKVLPGYCGEGRLLYRGECLFLYDQQKLGFCWTPKQDVAIMFASGLNALESGGVLLKAFAPASAILASPNNHSQYLGEDEYTCDPTALQSVEVLEMYPKL